MPRETWVASNRRVLGVALLPPAMLLVAGIGMCFAASTRDWQWAAGLVMSVVGAVGIGFLIRELFRPRVGYRPGHVEFYLRGGAPLAVPLEYVEAFFLGQGEALLPAKVHLQMETVTLVARLSRRAQEWSHVEVNPVLGRWCDGYVTIRGMWCEPLTVELVERLNRRLYELGREYRSGTSK